MTMKFFGKRGFRSNYSKVKPRIRIVAKVKYDQLTKKAEFNTGIGLVGLSGLAGFAQGLANQQQFMQASRSALVASQQQAFSQQQAMNEQRMIFQNNAARGQLRSGADFAAIGRFI